MMDAQEHLDRIEIKDLSLRCIIGINAEERKDRQDVLINIVMLGNFRQAAESDDIQDAVNYRTVTKQIIEHVEPSQYFLLESMAEGIADICLRDPHVRRVQIGVEKPGALRFARSVGVRIERKRGK
jgi:dihydroneopterin aldolase/D-erythro-7,8-dihydroneopterin triphosphate epimerase